MSVRWTDKDREAFVHCVECEKMWKTCPGWKTPTGGCADGKKRTNA